MSDISFTILPHGHIENDLAWNVAVPNPASRDEREPKGKWVRVPSFSVLIRHSDLGYVLYDTGSCPGDEADRLPETPRKYFPLFAGREEFLDRRLASLGLKPADISLVILSHMHWDHSGGLCFFEGTKAGGCVYVHKKDFMYGLCVTHQSRETFAGGGYFKPNFEFSGLTFHLVEEDETLAEGLELITLTGHTPGLLGLVVHLADRCFIFPSDAVYTAQNYGPPEVFPGIVYDTLGFQRSVLKLRRLEKKYGAKLIFPHDPEQFAGLICCPHFYR